MNDSPNFVCTTLQNIYYFIKIMPSSLYASVKQSVVEYAELKKKNERVEEKLLFKWKLVTILLTIIFIVLIGLFSQYLKNINSIPDVQGDYSFAVPLLAGVNPESVTTIGQARNIISAMISTAERKNEHFQYNQAQKIYSGQANITYANLMGAINNRKRLLLVFSKVYNTTYSARFAIYAHRGFSGQESSGGTTTIKDESDSQWSSIFSINNASFHSYDNSACTLFRNNGNSLIIFESISTTTQGGQTGIILETAKPECFDEPSSQRAFTRLLGLTGIQSQGQTTQTVLGVSLDVFALSLNQEA